MHVLLNNRLSSTIRLFLSLDQATCSRQQTHAVRLLRKAALVLVGQHHVEVQRANAQLHGATGAPELFVVVDEVVNVFEVGVGACSLLELVGALFLGDPEPMISLLQHLGHSLYLLQILILHEAFTFLVRHLPDNFAWSEWLLLRALLTTLLLLQDILLFFKFLICFNSWL